MDDDENVDDSVEGPCFQLKGSRLEDLIQKLEQETGLEDIIVCCRNRVNGKLYPLRLALPPDNAPMHVFIVPSTSRGRFFFFFLRKLTHARECLVPEHPSLLI